MLDEAKAKGLELVDDPNVEQGRPTPAPPQPRPRAPAHDQLTAGWTGILWALTGLRRRAPAAPTLQHSSLKVRLAAGLEDGLAQPPLHGNKALWLALVLVVLASWAVAVRTGNVNPGWGTSAFDLLWQQLTAFSADARQRLHATYSDRTIGALWLDLALILSYSYLACVLVAWSVRRLRYWHVDQHGETGSWQTTGRLAHHRLWKLALFLLPAAPLSDLLENWLTSICVRAECGSTGLLLSLATLVNVLSLLAILALFLFAACQGRRVPVEAPPGQALPPGSEPAAQPIDPIGDEKTTSLPGWQIAGTAASNAMPSLASDAAHPAASYACVSTCVASSASDGKPCRARARSQP